MPGTYRGFPPRGHLPHCTALSPRNMKDQRPGLHVGQEAHGPDARPTNDSDDCRFSRVQRLDACRGGESHRASTQHDNRRRIARGARRQGTGRKRRESARLNAALMRRLQIMPVAPDDGDLWFVCGSMGYRRCCARRRQRRHPLRSRRPLWRRLGPPFGEPRRRAQNPWRRIGRVFGRRRRNGGVARRFGSRRTDTRRLDCRRRCRACFGRRRCRGWSCCHNFLVRRRG
jgi:hypothetical protein